MFTISQRNTIRSDFSENLCNVPQCSRAYYIQCRYLKIEDVFSSLTEINQLSYPNAIISNVLIRLAYTIRLQTKLNKPIVYIYFTPNRGIY